MSPEQRQSGPGCNAVSSDIATLTAEQLIEGIASVWVGRWLEHGGSLIIDANCDHVQIGMREGWRRDRGHPEPTWRDGWIVGRWRTLWDLVDDIPGLSAAIIHHVALNGKDGGDGRRIMYLLN